MGRCGAVTDLSSRWTDPAARPSNRQAVVRPLVPAAPLALALLAVGAVGMASGRGPDTTSGAQTIRVPVAAWAQATWPQTDTRAYALLASVHDRCAVSHPRPLTAGSYTQPDTGLTLRWPDGWTLVRQDSEIATLTAPITLLRNGIGPVLHGNARFSIMLWPYGKDEAMPRLGPDSFDQLNQSGGIGAVIALVGQPATLAWGLEPLSPPGCSGACETGRSVWPPIMDVTGWIQFAAVRNRWPNGVALRITGDVPANAQPSSVFCDMEAMILGVTLP